MQKVDIAIVDYGMGNLRSVFKAVEHVADSQTIAVTSDAKIIQSAQRVIFPGQGAMPDCMRELEMRGLRDVIIDVANNKPFLGICIGMQLLFKHSEEGDTLGLGLLEGNVKRFAFNPNQDNQNHTQEKLKIPHMGWNQVIQTKAHDLWANIEQETRFYHVHSYYTLPLDNMLTAGITEYGHQFCSAIAKENIFATQFHIEKSAQAGLQLLRNFVSWQP